MWDKRVAVVLGVLILGAGAASAQNFGAPVDRYLRLEWEVEQAKKGPRITGYVYNDRGLWALNVQLLVEAQDAAGRTVSQTRGYVGWNVPPMGRASFEVAVPPGTAYRVRIESFDWLKGGPSS